MKQLKNKSRLAKAFQQYPELLDLLQFTVDAKDEISIVLLMFRLSNKARVVSGQHPKVYEIERLMDGKRFKVGDNLTKGVIIGMRRENINSNDIKVTLSNKNGDYVEDVAYLELS